MKVTLENYRLILPSAIHEKFIAMANFMFSRHDTRSIYYEDGKLIKR